MWSALISNVLSILDWSTLSLSNERFTTALSFGILSLYVWNIIDFTIFANFNAWTLTDHGEKWLVVCNEGVDHSRWNEEREETNEEEDDDSQKKGNRYNSLSLCENYSWESRCMRWANWERFRCFEDNSWQIKDTAVGKRRQYRSRNQSLFLDENKRVEMKLGFLRSHHKRRRSYPVTMLRTRICGGRQPLMWRLWKKTAGIRKNCF